jgi:hypothetical protein
MGTAPAYSAWFFYSAQLRRNIDEARKTALSGDTSSNGEELLLGVIRLIVFDLA